MFCDSDSLDIGIETEGLSEWFVKVLRDVADKEQVPDTFVFPSMFTALSAAAGNSYTVKGGGYVNNLALYCLLVAPSGSNKSAPANAVFAPFAEVDEEMYDAYMQQKEQDEEKGQLSKTPRQVRLQDFTMAALSDALVANPRGVLCYNDEISGLLSSIASPKNADQAAKMIDIYEGQQVKINRVTRGTMMIKKPYMSMYGGIQDDVLDEILTSPQITRTGFMQRMCVFTGYPFLRKYQNRELNPEVQASWREGLRWLLFNDEPVCMELDGFAQRDFADAYDEWEEQKHARRGSYMSEVTAKLPKLALKFAALCRLTHDVQFAIKFEPGSLGRQKGYLRSDIRREDMQFGIWMSKYLAYNQSRMEMGQTVSVNRKMSQRQFMSLLYERYPNADSTLLSKALGVPRGSCHK